MAGEQVNVLQIDNTLPGRCLAGKYWVKLFLLILAIMYCIPWGYLYDVPIYFDFILWMGQVYPNIHSVVETRNHYPEYTMAVLAFCGFVGPFFLVFYFIYGFFHAQKIDVSKISYAPKKVVIGILLASFFVILAIPFEVTIWNGDSFYLPDFFHQFKVAIIFFSFLIWWCVSVWVFIFSSVSTILWLAFRKR